MTKSFTRKNWMLAGVSVAFGSVTLSADTPSTSVPQPQAIKKVALQGVTEA